jgi:hypothetical protein
MLRSSRRASLVALFLLPAAACEEDPSFRLRWRICEPEDTGCADDADGSAPLLLSASQCSTVGIGKVRVTTKDAFGLLADIRERACFPSGFKDAKASVNGPALPPGTYSVEVRGLRRSARLDEDGKSLFGWEDEDGPLVIHTVEDVEIVEDEILPLESFELLPPPQCDDGVDNDNDGATDLFDPACSTPGQDGREEGDGGVTLTQFRLELSLLNHNPNARCAGLGIARFRVALLDGSDLIEPITCPAGGLGTGSAFFFTDVVPGGVSVLEVTAVDKDDVARTRPVELALPADPGEAGTLSFAVDFDDGLFEPPILDDASFTLAYRPHPDATLRFCDPPGAENLVIDEIGIHLLDAHGRPLDPPATLATDSPVGPGATLDGTPFSCPNREVWTTDLTWGGYLMEVQAFSPEGDVCFATVDPIPLGPGENVALEIPRADPVAASCRDCESDDDCGGTCNDAGVCVPKP